MNTMADLYDIYSKRDILLLVDVFEKFLTTCLEYYRLNSCQYFSSSGLSWDAIELNIISRIDIYLFIEKEMRGGFSYIARRYNKTNNKYLKCYDNKSASKCIIYLDANNLYSWAMSQRLPYDRFKWLNWK